MKKLNNQQEMWLWVIGLIIIAGFFLFFKLGFQPIGDWDEAIHAEVSRNIIQTHNLIDLKYFGIDYFRKPPIRFWLGAVVYHFFGVNDVTTRILSPIFSLAIILLIFFFTRKIFRSNFWAGMAALITLFSPIYLTFGHTSRSGEMDMLLVFFMLAGIFLLWKGFEDRKYFYLGAIAIGLACMVKPVISLTPLIGFFLYWIIFKKLSKIWIRRMAIGVIIILILVVPWHLMMILRHPGFWSEYWGYHVVERATTILEDHHSPWRYYFVYLIKYRAFSWFSLALVGMFQMWRQRKTQDKFWVYLLINLVVFLCIISAAQTRIYWYILPAIPMVAIFAVKGLRAIVENIYAGKYLTLYWLFFLLIWLSASKDNLSIILPSTFFVSLGFYIVWKYGFKGWAKLAFVIVILIYPVWLNWKTINSPLQHSDSREIVNTYGDRLRNNLMWSANVDSVPSWVYYLGSLNPKKVSVEQIKTTRCGYVLEQKGQMPPENGKILFSGNELIVYEINSKIKKCQ